jgi:hypothetical protein
MSRCAKRFIVRRARRRGARADVPERPGRAIYVDFGVGVMSAYEAIPEMPMCIIAG